MKDIFRKFRYLLEALIAYPIFYTLKYMPLSISSPIGGFIARAFGKFHKTNEVVLDNLRHAFPDRSEDELKEIAKNCWDNLGRTATEFPKITAMKRAELEKICELKGAEVVEEYKKQNKGVVVVSAHIGNWELASRYLLDVDPRVSLIYRKANNPMVENLIQQARAHYTNFIIQKGDKTGVRDIVKHLKSGGSLGNLADQKMREGIEIDFFGRKVKAPVTAAELAKKFDMPIIMARVVRDEKRKIDNYVFEFSELKGVKDLSAEEIVQKIYKIYESWITEYPSQWFWMHKRWKK